MAVAARARRRPRSTRAAGRARARAAPARRRRPRGRAARERPRAPAAGDRVRIGGLDGLADVGVEEHLVRRGRSRSSRARAPRSSIGAFGESALERLHARKVGERSPRLRPPSPRRVAKTLSASHVRSTATSLRGGVADLGARRSQRDVAVLALAASARAWRARSRAPRSSTGRVRRGSITSST